MKFEETYLFIYMTFYSFELPVNFFSFRFSVKIENKEKIKI